MDSTSILVVDDNPMNLKLARLLLSPEFDVRTAARAEEALVILQSVHPRLALVDIQLPGMDGLELARRVKASPTLRDIIVVAVTAYAFKHDERRARDAGCDGYIAKPIDTRALPDLVRAYLR